LTEERRVTVPGHDISREMESIAGKLNDAARDLIEALEGGLPKDFEKNLRGGDTSVFVRKLYLARGSRLPKQVAERYSAEKQLAARVDGFVRLFERLVDAAAEAPKGANLVEACHASEAGKVYALLCDTIGRTR
jgi:hypothetical protein